MRLRSLLCMLWISSLVVSALMNARLPGDGGRGERRTFSSQSLVLVCWSPGLGGNEKRCAWRGGEGGDWGLYASTAWLYLEAGLRPPVRGY